MALGVGRGVYSKDSRPKGALPVSIRPVKHVAQSKPTLEGAGVKLRRAFGFGDTSEYDPFLLFDDFRNDNPDEYSPGFRGTPTAGSKRSPMCSRGRSNMATASGIAGAWARATCSG